MLDRRNKNNNAIPLLILLGVILCSGLYLFREQSVKQLEKPEPVVVVPPKPQLETCRRTNSYSMEPEFERAISLVLQRYKQNNSYQTEILNKAKNCLYITYSDLNNSGAEGLFYFDDSVSSMNKLVIEINPEYASTDDLTTAFLLSHELTHVYQFISEHLTTKKWSCVDSEVEAFYSQLQFGAMLNEEESDSVIARLEKGSQNSQLGSYEDLLNISWDAITECNLHNRKATTNKDINCFKNSLNEILTNLISSSEFYQQQCADELN